MEIYVYFILDIFIDTMGYAFTLPLFKLLGGCKVGCYVHYPTISTDMLDRVSNRTESFNNPSVVAKSPALSSLKLAYYRMFAKLYSRVGRSSDAVMVNSSWTENHIKSLWRIPDRIFKVYPPCDVEDFKKIPIQDEAATTAEDRPVRIVSVAQFRPEKDHALQLRALSKLRDIVNVDQWRKIKLVLVGSVRNEDDEERVRVLKGLNKELDLGDHVEFRLNVSFGELKQELADGLIGIHTMLDEHFGIGKL
jgi:alpha-1,2-mannosyltransferase